MHLTTSDQEAMNLGFGHYTCNWGTHICGFYETERERDEILMGFLHLGDVEGDLRLFCSVERTVDGFATDCERAYPACVGQRLRQALSDVLHR